MAKTIEAQKQIILKANDYQLALIAMFLEEKKEKDNDIRNIHIDDLLKQIHIYQGF